MPDLPTSTLGDCGCECRRRFSHSLLFVKEWFGFAPFDVWLDPLNNTFDTRYLSCTVYYRERTYDYTSSPTTDTTVEFEGSFSVNRYNGWPVVAAVTRTDGVDDAVLNTLLWPVTNTGWITSGNAPVGSQGSWTETSAARRYYSESDDNGFRLKEYELEWTLGDAYTVAMLEEDVNGLYDLFDEYEPWDPALDEHFPPLENCAYEISYNSISWLLSSAGSMQQNGGYCPLYPLGVDWWNFLGTGGCVPWHYGATAYYFPTLDAYEIYQEYGGAILEPHFIIHDVGFGLGCFATAPLHPSLNAMDQYGPAAEPWDSGRWEKMRTLFKWPKEDVPPSGIKLCMTRDFDGTRAEDSTGAPDFCYDDSLDPDNPAEHFRFYLLRPPPGRSTANMIRTDYWRVTDTLTEDAETTAGGCPCA